MFQRPHQPSERAISKPYRFVSWPLGLDVAALVAELHEQPQEWLESQWKWHIETRFSVLRAGVRKAYPGSELTHGHSIDQPNLEQLPRLRQALDSAFPVRPAVAWLGRIPSGGRIFSHIDDTHHWDEHHRVHVPLITNPQARLCVAEHFLFLRPGRLWLLNNSVQHGVINRGPERLHLCLDLPHFEGFAAWLSQGTAEPGERDEQALAELNQNPMSSPFITDAIETERLARLRAQ